MSQPSQPSPDTSPLDADAPAEERVHHHARTGGDRSDIAGGTIHTLCGLTLAGPRPGAAEMPCCPMCALTMGRPCR